MANPPRDRRDLEEALAALREEYAARLERDIQEVSATVNAYAADLTDGALRERARFQAHRLKGSAGTFGFPAVSERAAELEELVRVPATSLDVDDVAGELLRVLAALVAEKPSRGP